MSRDVEDAGSPDDAWAAAVLAFEGALSSEQAQQVLCLPAGAARDADAAKAAFRRLSIRWHPDKHTGEDAKARATALFVRIAAAYHTLNTTNFDYTRWSSSFQIPPMQTLEDVLLLAMKGEDPFVVDALLRKRGDYRPHTQFGVNLAARALPACAADGGNTASPLRVPWSAGGCEEPSWEVAGAAHSSTQALPPASQPGDGFTADMQLALREVLADDIAAIEAHRHAGGSADRPWERVGAAGYGADTPAAVPCFTLRPDLQPGVDGARAAAEALNDAGLAHHGKKEHHLAATAFDEACRLCPDTSVYASNAAAAHLAAGNARRAAQCATDALALNPGHVRTMCRLGEACLALGEAAGDRGVGDRGKAQLREARKWFTEALRLDAGNKAAKKGQKDVALAWAAEFDSDEE